MGDLVLHGEDVSHLTVVGLPEVVSVPGVGQLRRHAQAVCGPAHAPAEHGRHLQRLTDLPHVLVLPLECERRRPGHDLELGQLRERVDELFADAVAQVFLLWGTTHVHERQHGNRLAGTRRYRRRAVRPAPAASRDVRRPVSRTRGAGAARAPANSAAVAKRSAGVLASARTIASSIAGGTAARIALTRGGAAARCWRTMLSALGPV